MSLRRTARDLFSAALAGTSIESALARRVTRTPRGFACADHGYAWDELREVRLIAIGKAAAPMARAFHAQVNPPGSGLVVGPTPHESLPAGWSYVRGGHPQPDEGSLDAARALEAALRARDPRDLVVFLVSGGGSALVEQSLDDSIPLGDIAATHKRLVESGASIDEINTVRKHLSAVKGGRLARLAAPARQLSLFVSDVPPGRLDALASGPTLPDPTRVADARAVLERYGLARELPARVVRLLDDPRAESLKAGDAAFARSAWEVLLDSRALAECAQRAAAAQGWHAVIDEESDDSDAAAAADHLVGRLVALRRTHARACVVAAGEVTVRVDPQAGGRGGRNQHFALLAAQRIAGREIAVLSAGSDGIDGDSPAAGAVVDGSTLERARALGLDVARALAAFDSHALLARLGDAIVTGPTGNNLRDLRILLAP